MTSPRPPARSRVAPTGDIVAVAGRGAWMGNRGVLHDASGSRDVVRVHAGKAWITCALSFKDQRLPQWEPGRYTQLFFLDEALALAAGHRPCAYCRRPAYLAYRAAWVSAHGGAVPLAPEMDAVLHAQRLPVGTDRPVVELAAADLPDGVFLALDEGPAVVVGETVRPWDRRTNVYADPRPRPNGVVRVLTPPAHLGVLRAGYPVQIG